MSWRERYLHWISSQHWNDKENHPAHLKDPWFASSNGTYGSTPYIWRKYQRCWRWILLLVASWWLVLIASFLLVVDQLLVMFVHPISLRPTLPSRLAILFQIWVFSGHLLYFYYHFLSPRATILELHLLYSPVSISHQKFLLHFHPFLTKHLPQRDPIATILITHSIPSNSSSHQKPHYK